MPISVDCMCGRPFRIKEELAGKKVRCPDCKSVMTVPEAASALEPEYDYVAEEIPEPAAPAPIRKVQPIRLPSEYAPSRSKADYESEADLRAKFTGRKPKKRKKSEGWMPVSVSPTIVSGVLMMIGAVVWFFAGLAAGIIFFYPPILFGLGVVAVVKGFTGRD